MTSALVADLVAAAVQELQADSGAPSSCAIAKAGRSVGGRKAAEGRWAALREVQRRADAGESPAAVAAQQLQLWSDDLRRHQQNNSSVDWITYRAGGVAALRELVQASDGGED